MRYFFLEHEITSLISKIFFLAFFCVSLFPLFSLFPSSLSFKFLLVTLLIIRLGFKTRALASN